VPRRKRNESSRRERSRSKPTVYLDSNVLSVLEYGGSDVDTIHERNVTEEWWDTERRYFRVFASSFTERELRGGDYRAQAPAIRRVRRLPYLPLTRATERFTAILLEQRIVPGTKRGDATHLAIATVHRVDYLLTWNHAHLANVHVQRRVTQIANRHGWRAPLIVSPELMPRVAMGQDIRRSADEG
jgi:hypothetical protein